MLTPTPGEFQAVSHWGMGYAKDEQVCLPLSPPLLAKQCFGLVNLDRKVVASAAIRV